MKPFLRDKPYKGSIQGVILDWAGTAVDHGCRGPAAVFIRAFQEFGIEPTIGEAREPMGMEKREHVRAMLNMERLKDAWNSKYGADPAERDVDCVFALVQEMMPVTLADYAEPVPGCVEAMAALRNRGVKIGSCTGYNRPMMRELLPLAERAGFKPDCLVTSDEVPAGRPWPWMCWLNCMRLGIFPPEAVIKVGDTLADIQEGINAGHWVAAVTRTSNAIGMDAKETAGMEPVRLAAMEEELGKRFQSAGAHFVISSIADLPSICDLVEERLAKGERP